MQPHVTLDVSTKNMAKKNRWNSLRKGSRSICFQRFKEWWSMEKQANRKPNIDKMTNHIVVTKFLVLSPISWLCSCLVLGQCQNPTTQALLFLRWAGSHARPYLSTPVTPSCFQLWTKSCKLTCSSIPSKTRRVLCERCSHCHTFFEHRLGMTRVLE